MSDRRSAERDFDALYRDARDDVYAYAATLLRDRAAAEDVAAAAFERAYRRRGRYDARKGSPRAWLFAIVRNCCRTAQSGKGGAMSLMIYESGLGEGAAEQLASHPDPRPTPEEEVQQKDVIGRVREAVEAVPEPFREAVVLRDLEELSYAEIAEVTGVPIGTVMSRLARGRAILARELLPPDKATQEQSRSMK